MSWSALAENANSAVQGLSLSRFLRLSRPKMRVKVETILRRSNKKQQTFNSSQRLRAVESGTEKRELSMNHKFKPYYFFILEGFRSYR